MMRECRCGGRKEQTCSQGNKRKLKFHFVSPLFTGAGSRQEMYLVVVILMAAVLVHLFLRIDPVPRNSRGPGLRPSCWIRDCKFIIDPGRANACKPFDDPVGFRVR